MGKGKENRRTIRIATFAMAVLAVFLIAAAAFIFWKGRASDKPEKLIAQYIGYIESGSFDKMYAMLDKDSRANISKEDFITRNKNIYEGIGAANFKIKTGPTAKSGKGREVPYRLTMDTDAGEIGRDFQALFTRESYWEDYLLSWNDGLILPDLEETDKVSVIHEEAARGNILDRNGELLAGPGTAKSVGLVPGKLAPEPAADIEKLAQLLEITPDAINNQLGAAWVREDSNVPIKTLSAVKSQELEPELLSVPGVLISDTEVRSYPLGEKAAHLVGYVQNVTAEDLEKHRGEGYLNSSVIGRSGIENLYEKKLKGIAGVSIVIISEDGQEKEVVATQNVQDGEDVRLTIDSSLQAAVYEKLAGDKGCAVAMNPYTGEVLALVSTPSFDDNEFILGISEDRWNQLNSDEAKPLYNRFRQAWCPGSSFKPVTASIGLAAGTLNPDEDYGSSGLKWQKDESWGDYYVTTLHEYAPATMENALIYSDNIYFAKTALNIGAETLTSSLDKLGFNQKLPFEIGMSQSQYANESGKIDTDIQLADSGYGQGQILVNPMHLAALYTSFINGGNVMKPYLEYQDEPKKEVWLPSAFTPENAERVRAGLEKVVNDPNGTGYAAHRDDVILAGKTGTAEIKADQNDATGTELGWFGVFTQDPAAPKPVLLMSMIEDVKNRGGSGYVVEKSTLILNQYLQ